MYSAVKELYKMQIERDIERLNRVTIGLISAEFREDTVILNFGGGEYHQSIVILKRRRMYPECAWG